MVIRYLKSLQSLEFLDCSGLNNFSSQMIPALDYFMYTHKSNISMVFLVAILHNHFSLKCDVWLAHYRKHVPSVAFYTLYLKGSAVECRNFMQLNASFHMMSIELSTLLVLVTLEGYRKWKTAPSSDMESSKRMIVLNCKLPLRA